MADVKHVEPNADRLAFIRFQDAIAVHIRTAGAAMRAAGETSNQRDAAYLNETALAAIESAEAELDGLLSKKDAK